MSENKFKVGDFVKLTNEGTRWLDVIDTPWAIVTEVIGKIVVLDRLLSESNSGSRRYNVDWLEISENKPYEEWIVGDIIERISAICSTLDVGTVCKLDRVEGPESLYVEGQVYSYAPSTFKWVSRTENPPNPVDFNETKDGMIKEAAQSLAIPKELGTPKEFVKEDMKLSEKLKVGDTVKDSFKDVRTVLEIKEGEIRTTSPYFDEGYLFDNEYVDAKFELVESAKVEPELETKFKVGDYFLGKQSNMIARIIGISEKIAVQYSDDVVYAAEHNMIDDLYTKLENPEIGQKYSCKSDDKEYTVLDVCDNRLELEESHGLSSEALNIGKFEFFKEFTKIDPIVPKVYEKYVTEAGNVWKVARILKDKRLKMVRIDTGEISHYSPTNFEKYFTKQVDTPEVDDKIEYCCEEPSETKQEETVSKYQVGQVWGHPDYGKITITETGRKIRGTTIGDGPHVWEEASAFCCALELIEKEIEMSEEFKVGQIYLDDDDGDILKITKQTDENGRTVYRNLTTGRVGSFRDTSYRADHITLIKETKMKNVVTKAAAKTGNFAKQSFANIAWNWPTLLAKTAFLFSFWNPAKKAAKPAKFALQYALFASILAGIGYGSYYTYQNGAEMYDSIKIPSINIEWDAEEVEVVSSDPFGEDTV